MPLLHGRAYTGAELLRRVGRLEQAAVPIALDIKAYNGVGGGLKQLQNAVDSLVPKTGQIYKLKAPPIDPASLQAAAVADEK